MMDFTWWLKLKGKIYAKFIYWNWRFWWVYKVGPLFGIANLVNITPISPSFMNVYDVYDTWYHSELGKPIIKLNVNGDPTLRLHADWDFSGFEKISWKYILPSGNLMWLWKMAIYSEFSHKKWVSILMLVYQRVQVLQHAPFSISRAYLSGMVHCRGWFLSRGVAVIEF